MIYLYNIIIGAGVRAAHYSQRIASWQLLREVHVGYVLHYTPHAMVAMKLFFDLENNEQQHLHL